MAAAAATAALRRRETSWRKSTGHSEDRKLLFHFGAVAMCAINGAIVARHDFFKSVTAIFTDVFKYRHEVSVARSPESLVRRSTVSCEPQNTIYTHYKCNLARSNLTSCPAVSCGEDTFRRSSATS